MEVLLHWLVALGCQQLEETEVRKWTFRGQGAKRPEKPICQLKSSWEWKKLFRRVGDKRLPAVFFLFVCFFFFPVGISFLKTSCLHNRRFNIDFICEKL